MYAYSRCLTDWFIVPLSSFTFYPILWTVVPPWKRRRGLWQRVPTHETPTIAINFNNKKMLFSSFVVYWYMVHRSNNAFCLTCHVSYTHYDVTLQFLHHYFSFWHDRNSFSLPKEMIMSLGIVILYLNGDIFVFVGYICFILGAKLSQSIRWWYKS